MKRWLVVGMAATGLVSTLGIIGSTAAAGGSTGSGVAPDKTQPSTSAAPGGPLPTAAPPTSAWITTTPPNTAAPITAVPATVTGPPITGTSVVPVSSVAPVSSFDGATWLTEVYAALADDPFDLLDIGERTVVLGTAADLFLVHLLGVTIAEQFDAGIEMPEYTVALEGKAVRVCREATTCDVFSDFYAPTGLLETFSINGAPIAISASLRNVNVESLTIDSAICRTRSDGMLSCALLVTSEGASTALHWDQVVFTAVDGRQFGADIANSVFTPSIADGGFGSAHILFPGAPVEGDISLPIVSGMTGVQTVATVSVEQV